MSLKKITMLLILMVFSASVFADVSVGGYYRKDGTYVQPHYRSNPNSSTYDNWSTKGNVNPYTGKEGTRDPQQNKSWGNYR